MRSEILNLIKQFSGQSAILTIPRPFIDYTGSLESALVLSQLLFLTKDADEDGWIYMSYPMFEKELSLNEYQVRKAKNKLEKMGILETKLRKVDGAPTLHFRLKEANFSESILQFLKNPICKNERNFKESAESEESLRKEENRELKDRESNTREDSENEKPKETSLDNPLPNYSVLENITKESVLTTEIANRIQKLWINTWGRNPKLPEVEATFEKLLKRYGFEITKNIMYDSSLKNFKNFSKLLDSIDENGIIKPLATDNLEQISLKNKISGKVCEVCGEKASFTRDNKGFCTNAHHEIYQELWVSNGFRSPTKKQLREAV